MVQGPVHSISLLLACLLGFAGLAGAQSAERAKRAAALNWVRLPGAEDCRGGDALSRSVEAKLRREVFPAPRNASVLIEGYVERAAGGYRASLQMRSSAGQLLGSRELSSPHGDCDELSETVAVVLAVMIDPDAAAQGKATQPAAPKRDDAAPDPRRAQRVLAFARIALGILEPGPVEDTRDDRNAWGMGLAYERGLGRWGGLRVEAVGFLPVTQSLGATQARAGGPVDLTLAYAGLGYCPLWLTTGRLRSAACASAELGGVGVDDAKAGGTGHPPPPSLWVSGSLRARFALRLVGPLELHLAGGATAPIVGGPFGEQDNEIRVNDFYGDVDIGLGVRF